MPTFKTLDEIIRKACAYHQEDRFRNMSEVRAALEQLEKKQHSMTDVLAGLESAGNYIKEHHLWWKVPFLAGIAFADYYIFTHSNSLLQYMELAGAAGGAFTCCLTGSATSSALSLKSNYGSAYDFLKRITLGSIFGAAIGRINGVIIPSGANMLDQSIILGAPTMAGTVSFFTTNLFYSFLKNCNVIKDEYWQGISIGDK